MVTQRLQSRAFALVASLALVTGCTYDWPEPGTEGTPIDAPTSGGGSTSPQRPSTALPTGPRFCDSVTAQFCDDFDVESLSIAWDNVDVQQPANLSAEFTANAPSNPKAMVVRTSSNNNPGSAHVETSILGKPTLSVSFVVLRDLLGQKAIDFAVVEAPQADGTVTDFTLSIAPTGDVTLTQRFGSNRVESVAAGQLPAAAWVPVTLTVSSAGVSLQLGGASVSPATPPGWAPTIVRTMFGAMNVQNLGGGWRLKFDNVVID